MTIEVIDNFLGQRHFDEIREVLSGLTIPWYYNDSVTGDIVTNQYYFTHNFYNYNRWMSEHHIIMKPIIEMLGVKAIMRIKGNLYPGVETPVEDPMHIDYPFEHKAAILYINTNNGYTVFEDGTKVEPVANRLVKFNGFVPHASSRCTDAKVRLNVNFNYF